MSYADHFPQVPPRLFGKRGPRARRYQWSARRSLLAAVLALGVLPAAAFDYEIEIDKTARLLLVRTGEQVLRTFPIAVGRGGTGDKAKRGDRKTPVGTYRVMGFNDSSRFDTFVRLNYPNIKDAYYGLRNAVISRPEFDRIVAALRAGDLPPQNTALGGAIGIHGIGEETPDKVLIHDNLDWTEGCIALRNAQVHELKSFLGVGTRVVIRE